MLRRLNYTSRKRINKSNIKISIIGEAEEKSFIVSADFNDLTLPGESKIYIEAYYRMMESQRYFFGTINKFSHPDDTSLGVLGLTANLKFRIVIVDDNGKILSSAENIKIEGAVKEDSLLPVDKDDLEYLLWNIKMEGEDGGPILVLNEKIPAIKTVAAHDPRFIHSVYPAVLREILTHIAVHSNIDLHSPDVDWQSNWILFSERIFIPPPEGRYSDAKNEIIEWIEGVVKEFSRRRKKDWNDYRLNRWDL
ncbi:MAG: hypothetical protein ACTSQY_06425 [Candidatus Odinarchaeia archaeon]